MAPAPAPAADRPTPDETASVRHAALPGGIDLDVRAVRSADVPGLARLYADLDDLARYRRFFAMFQPRDDFFAHLVSARDRGAVELVAVVREPAGQARIVAEAGFEPLPDGNGEFGIVVDRAWRGWLGAYLLDALAEQAAAAGHPALEADLLFTNGPMLALLRARGATPMPTGDPTILRYAFPTTRGPRSLSPDDCGEDRAGTTPRRTSDAADAPAPSTEADGPPVRGAADHRPVPRARL